MGFFNNYTKEGPGISKDAPKKRTFVVFFETFFRNFWKFGVINVIYSVIALPLVTSGLAKVGITNVARNTARDKHSFGLSDFFDTIKKNWKQALGAGIINTVLYALLIYNTFYFYAGQTTMYSVCLGLTLAMLFILTVMNYYIWTLMITFRFTLKQIYKNSFKFVFINLKMNLVAFFTQLAVMAAYVLIFYLSLRFGQWPLILTLEIFVYVYTFPGFKFLLEQYCIFPSIIKYIIAPYYEEHPDEDIEKRRDLGLPVPEDEGDEEEGEDENVFSDETREVD